MPRFAVLVQHFHRSNFMVQKSRQVWGLSQENHGALGLGELERIRGIRPRERGRNRKLVSFRNYATRIATLISGHLGTSPPAQLRSAVLICQKLFWRWCSGALMPPFNKARLRRTNATPWNPRAKQIGLVVEFCSCNIIWEHQRGYFGLQYPLDTDERTSHGNKLKPQGQLSPIPEHLVISYKWSFSTSHVYRIPLSSICKHSHRYSNGLEIYLIADLSVPP